MPNSQEKQLRRATDYEPVAISKAEMRDLFREEGNKLITETFSLLGVDIENQDSRNRVRDDFVWLRGVRNASEDTAKMVRKLSFGALITFVIGAIAAGIKVSLKAGV